MITNYVVIGNENGDSAVVELTDNVIEEITLEGTDAEGEYKTVLVPGDEPFDDIAAELTPMLSEA
jgi:hypothetical protein